MIKNWDYHNLRMDFSSMYDGTDHPSDIDMFYLGRDRVLILGEIKNEKGELKKGQRRMLEKLANGWKGDALCLFITHNKYYQHGDMVVNVADCPVREIYYKRLRQWRLPKRPVKVREIIEYYKVRK